MPSTSIRTAARSRSGIRSECRGRGLRSPRCTAWKSAAGAARSPPCASAWGRACRSRSSGSSRGNRNSKETAPVPMSAGYIPFQPNPSKPKYRAPAGAGAAHSPRFGTERRFPYAPERKYTPCDAPKEKLFALRDILGFDKNVIVQASCHSKDNRAMVDALEASGGKAKGVAFVGEEVTDAELKAMDRAGVRG